MKRKLTLQENLQLQPAHALWKQYRPEEAPFAFRSANIAEARRWQRSAGAALSRLIGFQDGSSVGLTPRVLERVDKGDYVREKILLRTAAHTLMPVYLLLPKGAARPGVVLAFAGHGYGVKDIVGLWEDGSERHEPDGYHKDFAVALCRHGLAVAAPEISCFGERQTDFSCLDAELGQPTPSTCAHTAALAAHLGGSALGLRVRDARRLVDYLLTRRDLDAARLGAMGISGGGMHALFSAALDRRIGACVISGYFCTFRDSILAMHHCPCNFVPGLHAFGEMHDLAGLVAPRPMLIEAGSRDGIFPIASVRQAVKNARKVYGVFGASDAIETDYFEGRHQVSGRREYDFLAEKLVRKL